MFGSIRQSSYKENLVVEGVTLSNRHNDSRSRDKHLQNDHLMKEGVDGGDTP